jgi:hypothetical protein
MKNITSKILLVNDTDTSRRRYLDPSFVELPFDWRQAAMKEKILIDV